MKAYKIIDNALVLKSIAVFSILGLLFAPQIAMAEQNLPDGTEAENTSTIRLTQHGLPKALETQNDDGNTKVDDDSNVVSEKELTDTQQTFSFSRDEESIADEAINNYASRNNLGTAVSKIKCGLRDGGCVKTYIKNNRSIYIYFYELYDHNGSVYAEKVMHVTGALGAWFSQNGWENSKMGYPKSMEKPISAGVWKQEFERGTLFYIHGSYKSVTGKYNNALKEGVLANDRAYPITEVKCGLRDSGCVQSFRYTDAYGGQVVHAYLHGNVYVVSGSIARYWANQGWENSKIGYPSSDLQNIQGYSNVQAQEFEHAIVVDDGSTVYNVPENFDGGANLQQKVASYLNFIAQAKQEFSGVIAKQKFGKSVNTLRCGLRDGGCVQTFNKANAKNYVYYTKSSGMHSVTGGIAVWYRQNGWEESLLGYPTSEENYIGNSTWMQDFQYGKLYFSSAGVTIVENKSPFADYLLRNSNVGIPVNNIKCGLRNGGCVQTFIKDGARKYLYHSSITGVHAVTGAIGQWYKSAGWENSVAGYPSGDEKYLGGNTWKQEFEKATVYYTPDGIGVLEHTDPAVGHMQNNFLKYPIATRKCGLRDGGCVQTFRNTSNQLVALYNVNGRISKITLDTVAAKAWINDGWENSGLGYPTGQDCGNNSCNIQFENGEATPRGDVHYRDKSLAFERFVANNYSWIPKKRISNLRCGLRDGGCVITLRGYKDYDYAFYVTPNKGIYFVVLDTPMGRMWANSGWENGSFGYPTSNPSCVQDGCRQNFEYKNAFAPAVTYMDVPFVNQIANGAPMGCEGASLLQAMYYRGWSLQQYDLRKLLLEMPYVPDGGDPNLGFAGTPFKANGVYPGIWPKALAPWANRYVKAVDISGHGMDSIIEEIRNGNPVIFWGTYGYTIGYPVKYWWGYASDADHVFLVDGYKDGMFHVTDPAYVRGPKVWVPRWELERGYQNKAVSIH